MSCDWLPPIREVIEELMKQGLVDLTCGLDNVAHGAIGIAMSLVGGPPFFQGVEVDGRGMSTCELSLLTLNPLFPPHVVQVFQQSAPFLVSIVVKLSLVGSLSVAPR